MRMNEIFGLNIAAIKLDLCQTEDIFLAIV